jgi:hypothetical protein
MKLTIWQQFSSNHSNGIHVVGIFQSESGAKTARDRLVKFFEDLFTWRKNNPEHLGDVSQAEKDIAAEFGFEWTDSTDFIRELRDATLYPKQFRNLLEIQSGADSWTSKEPYEILVQKLGGNVAAWDLISVEYKRGTPTLFMTRIRATADNETSAEAFFNTWYETLKNKKEANLSRDGLVIQFSDFVLNLHRFTEIIKLLEDSDFMDIQYSFEKEVFDMDNFMRKYE